MTGWIDWFAGNPVAANLLMVIILVGGAVGAATVTEEVFPEIAIDRISIETPYLGAAPEEVESGVVLRIEEAVQGIDGIRKMQSTAMQGRGSVIVELELGTDVRRVVDEVKNQVDAITTFPIETEKPIIREMIGRTPVIDVSVSGATDVHVLKAIAEQVRDDLAATPEITQVDIASAPPYEISIEVSEDMLRRHSMSFDQVARAVRRSSLDLPGGSVQTAAGEVLLRTVGQAYRGDEYEKLVLMARPDGTRLLLGDVATVVDGVAETDQYARFDRNPAVTVSVYRTGNQSAIDVTAAVHRYVEQKQPGLPEGILLTTWQDQAKQLNERLSLMLENGAVGFLLVFGMLALFIDLRLAFWVSLGIPISFLGAVALMPALGVSVNVISLFAFILVLGILVDDAIIVGENIFRHQVESKDGLRGAVEGAREVAAPVVFAVLTTVAAFLPLTFVRGMLGDMFRIIPLVVIPCLVFSLVESLGILPAHLAHTPRRQRLGGWRRLQEKVAGGLEALVRTVYRPLLEVALGWRYVTAAIGVSTLILTGGVVLGGHVPAYFLPSVEADFMVSSITMPPGTPVAAMSDAVTKLEDSVARLRARIEQETGADHFRHVSVVVGDQPMVSRVLSPLPGPASAPNIGEVTVELAPAETRAYSSQQLGVMWQDETGPIPEAVELRFNTSSVSTGDDVDVQLTGPDLDRLTAAAAAVRQRLGEYAGVHQITDSFRAGKLEAQLGIRPAAEGLGLTLEDLARQVRQAFYGEEAQRIQRRRDDVRVMVRYPRQDRQSLGNLESMRIRTPNGEEVPFSHVAQVELGRGLASITRVDRRRAVNVTAAVDPAVAVAGDVVADLRLRVLPEVLTDYPGVSYTFEGAQAAQEDALGGLQYGFVFALLTIFALLAVPLRSYVQPLIVMAAIPFGFVGAVWGHVVMGVDVTVLSALGVVALAGVVVNDSLIMVHFINRARSTAPAGPDAPAQDQGGDAALQRAIRDAGCARFRPIMLTTLTTFVGVTPLMLERSMQAAFLVPMAVSLAFGVLFATFITLILVPVAYMILDDVQRTARRLAGLGGQPHQAGA